MDPTTAVSNIAQEFDARVSAPVRTSGMVDERPVPVVIVEDWSMEQMNFHNSAFAGSTDDMDVDGDGLNEYARWFRFYYDMRVELLVRDDDDVDAHNLLGEVQSALFWFAENPKDLHQHVNDLSPGTSGNVTYQFSEPKETEINQSFSLKAFHQVSRSDYDTIEQITETYDIT